MSGEQVLSSFRCPTGRRSLTDYSATEMEFLSSGQKRALTTYSATETEGGGEGEAGASNAAALPKRKRALTSSCYNTSRVAEKEIDGKEGERTILPECIVEKIVAMMPFPSIFKARGLSKSWRSQFSSISSFSREIEEKKLLATSFQKQVNEWSTRWESFSPTFIGREDILAYDHNSQHWRRLASLSFLPESMFMGSRNSFLSRSYYQIEGALLYGFARTEVGFFQYEMYVANIWTRTWKQLPPRPKAGLSFVLCSKLVCDRYSDSYKVILFCQDDCLDEIDQYSAQIYYSKSEGWSTQKFVIASEFLGFVGPSTCAYLNGILYMVAVTHPQNLLAFNLAEGTLEEIVLLFKERIEIANVDLMVCNANWLVMVTRGMHPDNMQVLRVDLQSQQLLELSRGPPAPFYVAKISPQPVSDWNGNRIFFRVEDRGTQGLAYNLDENEWKSFLIPAAASADHRLYRWIGSSCHPGLNPFVAV